MSEPTTEAGRRLNEDTWEDAMNDLPQSRSTLNFTRAADRIAAIEAEAAAAERAKLAKQIGLRFTSATLRAALDSLITDKFGHMRDEAIVRAAADGMVRFLEEIERQP